MPLWSDHASSSTTVPSLANTWIARSREGTGAEDHQPRLQVNGPPRVGCVEDAPRSSSRATWLTPTSRST